MCLLINLFAEEGEEVLDIEDVPDDQEEEQMIEEQMFTFDKYEQVP
jgi:hypothetical protein